jgi:hypothetical protein
MFTARFRLGTSARTNARRMQFMTVLAIIVMSISASILSPRAHAQTTRTWATPGANPDIGNGANWVGGVAPNFAGDATTDSAIFSASTNAAVRLRNVLTGDPFAAVTFDASAPAYTFSLPAGNTANELIILTAGQITNSSPNTQNLTGIAAVTLNGATGTPGTMLASSGNTVTNLSFDVGQIKFNNPGSTANGGALNTSVVDLTAGFDVRTSTILGVVNGATTSSLYVQGEQSLGTGGKLFITGNSGTNVGRLVVGIGGVVQITHNNALGDDGGANAANATILLGGFRNGRLELPGNITTNEAFTLNGRQGADIFSPHILSMSGTNTLTGVFRTGGGGNSYNLGADSGTLLIQSDINMSQAGDRYLTFLRAGNIVLNGNIVSSSSNVGVPLARFDTGTTTINGAANDKISHLSIRSGTLALGASAGITFSAVADDLIPPGAPRVVIDAGATFDVSAKVGGFNLTQTLQGSGTVKGSLIMAGGTQVLPGAIANYVINNIAIESFADAVGTLTFQSGGMNLSAGSSMVWQLGALSTSNPGVDFDQIVNGGNLVLGGTSNVTLDFSLVTDPAPAIHFGTPPTAGRSSTPPPTREAPNSRALPTASLGRSISRLRSARAPMRETSS